MGSKLFEQVNLAIEQYKYQEAINILNELESNEELSKSDQILSHYYRATALNGMGDYPEALKYAKKSYRGYRNQGQSSHLLETLIIMGYANCWLGNTELGFQYIDEAEDMLGNLPDIREKQQNKYEAMLYISRGCGYLQQGKTEQLFESARSALKISEYINDKQIMARSNYQLGSYYTFFNIDLNLAMYHSKQCQLLLYELDNKPLLALNLVTLGCICIMKGELNQALMFHEQALDNTNIIMIKMSIFNNLSMIYSQQGDFDKALEVLKNAFELAKKVKNPYILMTTITSIIEVNVLIDRIEEASVYLDLLKGFAEKGENELTPLYARFSEALILKSSNRIQNRAKAQAIFEEIAQIEKLPGELSIKTLLNLCDLLLDEFRINFDVKVLEELNPLLDKLIIIAEKIASFWILAETYLLLAKLALLKTDLKKARKILTEAQEMAEKYNLTLLAGKISVEHDTLLRNLEIWEQLSVANAPINKKLELVNLDKQIENMILNRRNETLHISDEEPVNLLILSEGGTSIFSHYFIEQKSFESHIFGGFITTIDYFIREVFSEGLDRAMFGEYTLLMKLISPFFIIYIFKGDSYYAHQRIKYFMQSIQKKEDIWQKLIKSVERNKTVKTNEIPPLDTLIIDIFVEKNVIIEKI
ncbi:MAG: tetratricopeptide repeat protein [Promethearchaeota archaeon]|nr:MAG: tetratricopeptide repeat protein [Candidatus Lokiarchaeota archaeon]